MLSNLPPCDCAADFRHSHQAWLEATLEVGRLEHREGKVFPWRERGELIKRLMHNWDYPNPGKIEP